MNCEVYWQWGVGLESGRVGQVGQVGRVGRVGQVGRVPIGGLVWRQRYSEIHRLHRFYYLIIEKRKKKKKKKKKKLIYISNIPGEVQSTSINDVNDAFQMSRILVEMSV